MTGEKKSGDRSSARFDRSARTAPASVAVALVSRRMAPRNVVANATSTWAALVEPRRLLPIVCVAIPLVIAQGSFSRDPLAVPLAVVLCLAFVLIGPAAYRALFLSDAPFSVLRLVVYVLLSVGTVGALGLVAPRLANMEDTFLTNTTTVGVSMALFVVGGWGLARDIDLEARLAEERARAEAMAREAERAQLHAIRANLDPHFLFNTLNAIAEWCREDGEVAERAILKLSSVLRAVLDGVRTPTWPLERELALVRAVFELHTVRSPSAFTLAWNVDERALGVPVLPLLVLPIAENAMKHGPNAGFTGEVGLHVTLGAEVLDVAIENPGENRGPRAGAVGVEMVKRRLALAYEDAASFSITTPAPGRTRVTLTLPTRGPTAERHV